jgi:YjbE family integral membrane protein
MTMEFGDGAAWLVIPIQIFFVDLLLGADNALVIALACRSLGPEDARKAIFIGAGGAVLLRLVLTVLATSLLAAPLVKLIGAAVLIFIALNVSGEHASGERAERSPGLARADLWSAASVIIVADSAMSLDNVVALAAIARGNFWLLAAGVAFSIPILAYGGLILTALLRNAPALIAVGAALLGWIAGDMAISDPLVADWANQNAPGLVAIMPALGAAFVLLNRQTPAPRPAPPAAAIAKPRPAARTEPATKPAARPAAIAPILAQRPAQTPSFEPPEPQAPQESALAPSSREDRVAIIGVLILALVAGLGLLLVSYLDSLY